MEMLSDEIKKLILMSKIKSNEEIDYFCRKRKY